MVSALPAGALVMGRGGEILGPGTRAGGGCLLLAAGLCGLAILPSASPWWAAAALACCGAGFGLATGVLDAVAESSVSGGALRRACALAIASRHAGLVLGLAVFAPLLSTDLDRASEQAALTGAETLLDARLNLSDKIEVARTLRDEVDSTPRGEMPDLDRAFRDADEDTVRAGVDLRRAIEAVLTRAFRTEFGVAAVLALLGAIPSLILARRMNRATGGAGASRAGAAPQAAAGGRDGPRGGGAPGRRGRRGRVGLRPFRTARPLHRRRRSLSRQGVRRHPAAHRPVRAGRRRLPARGDPGGARSSPSTRRAPW